MSETLKKYLDQAGLEALVGKIKSEDDAHLAEAKSYAEGLGVLYDPVNSASGAETRAKAYTDEKVKAEEDARKAAITETEGKVTAEETARKAADEALQGAIDGVDAKAVKNAEDIAALTKTHSDDKVALDAKDAELAGAIEDLAEFVGELPEGATAKTIVEYVTARTEGIATDSALEELQATVDGIGSEVSAIKGDYLKAADKTELAEDIEEVQGNVDDLAEVVSGNKTELEGKINAKADQTALEAVSAVANAAVKQSDYDVKVKALEDEDVRIAGLVATEAETARAAEKANAEAIAAIKEDVDAFFKDADMTEAAKETLKDIQGYITEHTAEAGEMTAAIQKNKEDIAAHVALDHDFAGADAALKSELEGKINGKVAQGDFDAVEGRVEVAEGKIEVVEGKVEVLEGKVETLEGEMDAVQAAVATKAEAQDVADTVATLTEADEALSGRLDAVEAMLGDGDDSVSEMIASAKQEAIDAAANDATQKANKALEDAKKYADDEDAKIESRVAELETASATHALASDLEALATRVGTAEGEIDTLQGEMDAVEALAAANEAAIAANAAAIALKASQADLDTLAGRVTTVEGAVATKAEQEALNAAVLRIAQNETNIAANTSALGKFKPIDASDIEGMFA